MRASYSRLTRATLDCCTTSRAARASPDAKRTPSTHLRLAIEIAAPLRDFAAGDSDFDPLRGEPEFEKLVG